MKFLHQNILLIVVFATGASILIIELTALRILTPFFGNTIFSATSVITTILLSLSIGYYLGGRLSDKHPEERIFYLIILASGVLVLVMYTLIITVVPSISYSLNLTTGPLIVSLILFLVPSLLLGMLTPFVITLQKKRLPKEGVGRISGNVFFVSTFGSIIGSLLTGFYLVPNFGARQIILATGMFLLSIGFVGYYGKHKSRFFPLVLILFLTTILTIHTLTDTGNANVYAKDGVYTHIAIVDSELDGRPARFFIQDTSLASGIYLDGDDLAFKYSRYYELYKLVTDKLDNVFVIGAGTYSIPKAFYSENDHVVTDVSDIEPGLEELARKYFGLGSSDRIVTHTTDGRRYLHDTNKTYDVIFSDVYFGHSIPQQFTSIEFFRLAKSKLSEDGVIFLNVIGSQDASKNEFLLSEMKTFRSVFPNSIFFAVENSQSDRPQNFIFMGTISDKSLEKLFTESNYDDFKDNLININSLNFDNYTTLTDDFSPVDFMNAKTMLE